MRKKLTLSQTNFSGGQFDSFTDDTLPPNVLAMMLNARLRNNGSAARRHGTQRIHAVARPSVCTALYSWKSTDDVLHMYYFRADGGIDRFTNAIPSVFTAVTGAASVSATIQGIAVLNNTCYVADKGPLNKIDSADTFTGNIAGTPAAVTHLAAYNTRLFGANGRSLYYSALDNGDTLGNGGSGGGTILLQDTIMGLLQVGGSLLIFHPTSISRFTGWGVDDFDVQSGQRGISQTVGLWGNPTTGAFAQLAVVGLKGYFATSTPDVIGVFEVTETGTTLISPQVDQGIISGQHVSVHPISPYPSGPEVHFGVGGGGWALLYNYQFNAWTQYKVPGAAADCPISSFSFWISDFGANIYAAMSGQSWVTVIEGQTTFLDNVLSNGTGGVGIDFQLQTAPLSTGDLEQVVAARSLAFQYFSNAATDIITSYIEFDSGTIVPTQTLTAAAFGGIGTVQAAGQGTRPRIRLTSTSISGSGELIFGWLRLTCFGYGARISRGATV